MIIIIIIIITIIIIIIIIIIKIIIIIIIVIIDRGFTWCSLQSHWRVHQMMCKAMERLLWMRFVYKVKPAIGNDLQQAAEENADEIVFETIPCDRFLLQKFK